MQEAHIGPSALPTPTESNDEMDHMELSETAKKRFKQHALEGFLRIVEAPPHGEAEKVVKKIDTEVIIEEAIRALTGLLEGGIYSIHNPSPETLTRFLGEYSARRTALKAVRMLYSVKSLECYTSMDSYIPAPRQCQKIKMYS